MCFETENVFLTDLQPIIHYNQDVINVEQNKMKGNKTQTAYGGETLFIFSIIICFLLLASSSGYTIQDSDPRQTEYSPILFSSISERHLNINNFFNNRKYDDGILLLKEVKNEKD